jgi:hypothetical protein
MCGLFKKNGIRNNLFASIAVFLMVLSIGCSKSGQFTSQSWEDSNQSQNVDTPNSPDSPSSSEPPAYKMVALAWESSKYPERTLWSTYLQKVISEDWSKLLPGANDITSFCPTYYQLDNDERANVWAQLFVAMAKYESGFNPTSRMQETTMGTDPVTNKPVYSEGLLQLSYQDRSWAPWCDFDWTKDRSLAMADPQKTILDPFKNLYCGVGIMAKQIQSKGSIILSTGAYWAVIKSGGRYQQIGSIQGIVKSLSLCK